MTKPSTISSTKPLLLLGRTTRPHGIKGELRLEYYAQSTKWIDISKKSSSLSTQTGLFLRQKDTLKPIIISSWREVPSKDHNSDRRQFIIRMQGVADRNASELLRQHELVIEESIVLEAEQKEQEELAKSTEQAEHQEHGERGEYTGHDELEAQDLIGQAPFLHQLENMQVFSKKSSSSSAADNTARNDTSNNPDNLANDIKSDAMSAANKNKDFEHIGIIEEIIFPAGQETWCIRSLTGKEILFPAISIFVDHYDLESSSVYICPPEGLLDIYLAEPEKKMQTERANPQTEKAQAQAQYTKAQAGNAKVQAESSSEKKYYRKSSPKKKLQ